MNAETRLDLISYINDLLVAIKEARFVAIDAGNDKLVDKLKKRRKKLSKLRDKLIQAQMKDWIDNAEAITERIKSAEEQTKIAIKELKDDIRNAKKWVVATGLIDDAIDLITSLLP
ncbi:hypothetical protein C9J12_15350 [Photobacterium frigidiphilum]|uniref:Uncharacterized protein n=1 Tax=Photobacterium frigidiphilum TaxID=264736 RepID=A0A2T3JEP0_9GAMM|nr:hypothetical protein [Photobacterium frigidiphilum]PSU47371.1 hypothetical protein C9J12_15350 [Photobacterium frigidiphilum]